jgi:hypothetical protein
LDFEIRITALISQINLSIEATPEQLNEMQSFQDLSLKLPNLG